jgi:alanyl-tRNA synthetase
MTRTVELHRAHPELFRFAAEIVRVELNGAIELASTAFYARSGGQAGDTGLIGGVPVLDTVYSDGISDRVVHHLCEPSMVASLKPGTVVEATIDEGRRREIMALHSAQHLLYIAAEAVVGEGSLVGGGDISDERARIDMAWPADRGAFPIADVDAIVSSIIGDDLEIVRYADATDPSRQWWQVDGYSPIPCGGTHVSRTSGIGSIEITANRKGSKAVRLTATRASEA